MSEIRETFGLKIVTEALEEAHVDLIEAVWRRHSMRRAHMQNFSLLRKTGRSKLPCFEAPESPPRSRNGCGRIQSWLEGNYNVISSRTRCSHFRTAYAHGANPGAP